MNKKISLFIIFAFSILILFLNILDEKNNELNKNYLITDGVTRLSQFDIDNNKTLALNGKWTKLINGKVVGYTFISDALLENNSDIKALNEHALPTEARKTMKRELVEKYRQKNPKANSGKS